MHARHLVLAGFVWALPVTALAQPTTDPSREADQRFAEGKELFRQHRFSEARVKFSEACAAHRTINCPLNLGLSEYELGMYAEAATHLYEYLHETDLPKGEAGLPRIQKIYDEAYAKSGHFEVSAPDGSEVFVDDRDVGKAPLGKAVHVKAGPHVVKAVFSDGRSARDTATATDGQVTRVSLALAAPSTTGAQLPVAVETPPADRAIERKVAWPPPVYTIVLGAVAVASIGAGAAFLADASSKNDKIASAPPGVCANPTAPVCADLQDTSDARSRSKTLGTTFMVVGAASAVASVVTWVSWPRTEKTSSSAQLTPSVSTGGLGLHLSGHF
jgi:hypothetical protein